MKNDRAVKIFHRVVWGMFLCACLGLLCRLTVKDSVPYLSIFFYIFKPAILALCFFLAAWHFKHRTRAVMVGALFASAACFYWWMDTGFAFNAPASLAREENGAVKTLLWNTFHGRGGWDKIADEISNCNADLIVLIEAEPAPNKQATFWQDRFPAYRIVNLENSMMLLTRGAAGKLSTGKLAGNSFYARVDVNIHKQNFALYAVDFYSGPFNSRKSAFTQLHTLINRDYYQPVIVLGDFNTPEESYFFDELRQRKFMHVFSSTGSGMKATWPMPLPFLDLDHAWVSSKIKVQTSKLGWSALSDHRPLFFIFEFVSEDVPTLWAHLIGHKQISKIQ